MIKNVTFSDITRGRGMDKDSEKIENFLNFLRDCEKRNRLAALEEIEMDSQTQDRTYKTKIMNGLLK